MEDNKMTDEALVRKAHSMISDSNNAVAEILLRYEPTVRAIASKYFVAGADDDDVIQEGRIGLFKAIVNYSYSRSDKFKPFAIMCIKRQIQTAVMSASRKKHMPLNSYVSLDIAASQDGDGLQLPELAESEEKSPESILIDRESREDIGYIINNSLNPAEKDILILYMRGDSYKDIADQTGKTVKSVDNTIQGIKRKLKARIK